jgi:hypothetical protein
MATRLTFKTVASLDGPSARLAGDDNWCERGATQAHSFVPASGFRSGLMKPVPLLRFPQA